MVHRTVLSCLGVFALTLAATVSWADPAPAPMPLILNQSADSMFECVPFSGHLNAFAAKDMVVEGYQKLIDRYVGTNVSHIFFNVNFQRVAYGSAVCESYWDVPDPEKDTSSWPQRSYYAYKAGVDPFQVCVERCREKAISPWISVRMNDTHYHEEQHKIFSLWWDHPEYRRGVKGFHNGFDYAAEPVRAYYLALIKEVLERYDPDGIELDWMRFPYHFRKGEEQAGLDILTAFTRDVRKLADNWAARQGHAVGLAARVPATPDMSRALGMDAVRWVKEGLVTVLIPCATWRPSDTDMPIEEWRERTGEGAPPFILSAGSDLWLQGKPGGTFMKDNLESQRGFTAAMLHRSADSIYLFNHFNRKDFQHEFTESGGSTQVRDEYRALLSDAGDLEATTSSARRHVLTFRDTSAPGIVNPHPLPARIDQEHPAAFILHTGPRPETGRVTLRIGLDKAEGVWEAALTAQVNGTDCIAIADLNKPGQFVAHKGKGSHIVHSVDQLAPRVAQFEVPLAAMKAGRNRIGIKHAQGKPQTITWCEVYVAP